jgi:hypothetical protein
MENFENDNSNAGKESSVSEGESRQLLGEANKRDHVLERGFLGKSGKRYGEMINPGYQAERGPDNILDLAVDPAAEEIEINSDEADRSKL